MDREPIGYFCNSCGAGYYDEDQLLEHTRQLHTWRAEGARDELVLAAATRRPAGSIEPAPVEALSGKKSR